MTNLVVVGFKDQNTAFEVHAALAKMQRELFPVDFGGH